MNWLASIPDVVWAAIGGSCLTLLGVFVQLRYDAKQKDKEREMMLRREVYLPAAEQLAAVFDYIAKLPNADFDEQGKMEPIQRFIAAAAKINIIGSEETITASNVLVGKFNSLIVQLMSKKIPLIKLKYEIKTLEKIIEDCQARRQAALADMKSLNFNKETDKGLWQLVNSQFASAQESEAKYQDELAKKRNYWMKLTYKMLADCVEAAGQMQGFVTPVLISIRKELKLPLNQERYRKIIEQIGQEGKQAFDNFIADIKREADTPDK
jgi:hypothetical protein